MHNALGRPDDAAAKDLPYALMPHAHAKHGYPGAQLLYDLQ